MTSIYLTSTAQVTKWAPFALSDFKRLQRAAHQSNSDSFSLTKTAEEADFVLFVGSHRKYHSDIFSNNLFNRYSRKSILFDFQDNTIPRIPGIYMSLPNYLQNFPIYECGFYPRVFDNGVLRDTVPFSDCTLLFSFVGSVRNAPAVRERLMRIRHPRAVIRDAWSRQTDNDGSYAEMLSKSKFVLCPRGFGASTWRLFETMRSGRVPVVISDEWVEPKGLEWDEFSLRVMEADIENIPEILEANEWRADKMGTAARAAWLNNFSLPNCFHWLGSACERIAARRKEFEHVIDRNIFRETISELHLRPYYRELLSRASSPARAAIRAIATVPTMFRP